MRLNSVDLNLFVVFDVIYSEGNLTRAGEILCVTQPSVSNALSRLRETFDDQLFVRSGKRMVPTPAAQNLIGPVRQALRLLHTSVESRSTFDPRTAENIFQISAGDIVSSMLLPELLKAVRATAPGVTVQCFQVERRDLATEMAAGRLDFAVDIPLLAGTKLNQRKLLDDRYVCVLRNGHPAARRALTLDEYLAMEQITVSSRRLGLSYVDIALNRIGKRCNSVLRVQHYQPAFLAVQNSDMVVSAPWSLARRYDVHIQELPFNIQPLETLLYWHKTADTDPANRWMRQMITQVCARLMADAVL